jgi:hypothetical protein
MIFPRHVLVLGTLLLAALASPTLQPADTAVDWDLFHRLVDNVDESSIHSILHKLAPKFKHGIFSKDRSAIEQVHSENPPLATSLLSLARRASNATATTTSSLSSAASSLSSAASSLSSAASSATSSSASAAAASSVSSQEASLTSAQGSVSSALAASSARTASTVPPPTSLALAPTTPNGATAVATKTGGVVYSSSGGGLVTVASSIAFVTYQRSSQEILSTYTLPNGQLTTATSVVVVNAPITGSVETAGTAGAAQTTGGGAGLQSGAACTSRGHLKEIALVLGGAAVVAMAL